MRIAVRVDASRAMGWGHVKRCLSLAQALRAQGAECAFFLRHVDLDAAALVRQAGFEAHVMASAAQAAAMPQQPSCAHAGWLAATPEADAAAFVAAAQATGRTDLVLVDHYALDARWHDAVRGALGCGLAAIDDLADRPLAVDLVLDHNPCEDAQAKYGPVLRRPARLCSGGAYALLDEAYATHAPLPWRGEVASVGIFMGGTDAGGFSAWALSACRELAGWAGPVEIATTSSNPHLPLLRSLAARDAALSLQLDAPNLADFHARHDVQIGAGGGALWERCSLGVPTVALVCAPNQRLSVPLLARDGVVVGLEAVERSPAQWQALGAALRQMLDDTGLRRALRERSLQRVDGQGAQRAAAALLSLAREGTSHEHGEAASGPTWRAAVRAPASSCRVRRLEPRDLDMVRHWRNQPEIRRVMFTRHEIAADEHRRWFEAASVDPLKRLLVVEECSVAIGFVSFSGVRPQGIADWGFYAAPTAPKGSGRKLGKAALDFAFGELGLHKVCGQALSFNTASINLHRALGFRLEGTLREQHHMDDLFHDLLCFGLLSNEWRPGNI